MSLSTGRVLTRELVHAVHGAEVVLQGTVSVHGHVEVELWGEGEQGAGVVGVFDGSNTNTEQPVDIQHLLLDTDRVRVRRNSEDRRTESNTEEEKSWITLE